MFSISPPLSARQQGQLSFISEFLTDICHICGATNVVANDLSCPLTKPPPAAPKPPPAASKPPPAAPKPPPAAPKPPPAVSKPPPAAPNPPPAAPNPPPAALNPLPAALKLLSASLEPPTSSSFLQSLLFKTGIGIWSMKFKPSLGLRRKIIAFDRY